MQEYKTALSDFIKQELLKGRNVKLDDELDLLSAGVIDGPGHWVGGVRSDAGGLFLVGWSRTGGDLRVPHFFATHIMQALPLLGLALDRFRPESARTGIWIGALLSTAIVAATFVQAMSGRPFL